jgi:hypothetical protein
MPRNHPHSPCGSGLLAFVAPGQSPKQCDRQGRPTAGREQSREGYTGTVPPASAQAETRFTCTPCREKENSKNH